MLISPNSNGNYMNAMNEQYFILFVFGCVICETLGTNEPSVADLARRIDSVESQCATQKEVWQNENEMLKQQLKTLTRQLEMQDNHIGQLQGEIKDLQEAKDIDIHTALARSSRFLADQESTVAFHATIVGGAIHHLHINQTVIFNHEMLNLGGAYHSQHGVFVTTVPGIYIFSVSIMATTGANDSTMVFIMKNGKEVASAIADGRAAPHDQGSTTVVLQLAIGDEVWVSVQRHDDTILWGDSLDSFMGCLVAYT